MLCVGFSSSNRGRDYINKYENLIMNSSKLQITITTMENVSYEIRVSY